MHTAVALAVKTQGRGGRLVSKQHLAYSAEIFARLDLSQTWKYTFETLLARVAELPE